VPIVVSGRPWGAIVAAWNHPDAAGGDAETRMAQFTELVAAAIADRCFANARLRGRPARGSVPDARAPGAVPPPLTPAQPGAGQVACAVPDATVPLAGGTVRGLLVEAAWHAARTRGPLHGFHERLTLRRGAKIATVATARKMVVVAWHLLSRGQDYAFVRPALYREKLRKLELMIGAPRRQGQNPTGRQHLKTHQRQAEKAIAAQHDQAYVRMVRTGKPLGHHARNRAQVRPPGRASQRPSKGKAARQTP
jgi:hypothetical protein